MKKRFFAAVLGAALAMTAATGCGSSGSEEAVAKYGSDTLKVFNWGEYIGEDVISGFEDEFGVTVIYELFDSNEMMYTKIAAGDSYDVLIPSDYMIERLMNEGSLQPLDKSLIPNISVLTEDVIGLDFDPAQTYSVPYFYGSVGIVYNKNNVPLELLEEQGWDILKNTDYKGSVYMYDSERDSFMVALKALGYSMNTENEDEIEEAYQWLLELNSTMEPAYVTDEVIDAMAGGVKDLAVVYSGDAAYILSENEDMGYFTPNQGTNIWCDAMVIPENAENPALAHEFINYCLSYDAAYDNTVTVGYTSTNDEVKSDMASEGGDFYENEAYIPSSGYDLDEVFHDNQLLREKLSALWIKVKSAES